MGVYSQFGEAIPLPLYERWLWMRRFVCGRCREKLPTEADYEAHYVSAHIYGELLEES